MTAPFSRMRRLLIAGIALAFGAYLFRNIVSDALVLRGDDFLYAGDRVQALIHYRRSLYLDPDSQVAADRFAFVALLQKTPATLESALQVAGEFVVRHPRSAAVIGDRALCLLKLRRYSAAFLDFERTAALTRDPQMYTFAGWAALRAGRRAQAVAMWRAALRARRGYLPARTALETLR